MVDKRKHRGCHPKDPEFFAKPAIPSLVAAVDDLDWLLSRGYTEVASLKLVGDRHALTARQRQAVSRCACSAEARVRRGAACLPLAGLEGQAVAIDGFNQLIIQESMLGGGLLLRGRDGALRDLASIHGTYRLVQETGEAIARIGRILQGAGVAEVLWLLDRPVSNSGRLKALLYEAAVANDWPWTVELHFNPDPVLAAGEAVVVTGDGWILDRCGRWVDLAGASLCEVPQAWVLAL